MTTPAIIAKQVKKHTLFAGLQPRRLPENTSSFALGILLCPIVRVYTAGRPMGRELVVSFCVCGKLHITEITTLTMFNCTVHSIKYIHFVQTSIPGSLFNL